MSEPCEAFSFRPIHSLDDSPPICHSWEGVDVSTALFSFLGIIIGASLQYLFSRYLENQKHQRTLRTQAYTDYIRCVGEFAFLKTQSGAKENRELFARTSDSKARICIYGSEEVTSALAKFHRLGAVIASPEQVQAFVSLVAAMRLDTGLRGSGIGAGDIEDALIGPRNAETL